MEQRTNGRTDDPRHNASAASSAAKAKASMVHSVLADERGGCMWDPLRTFTIPVRLKGVFTTRHYRNPRLPYHTLHQRRSTELAASWRGKLIGGYMMNEW